ncbi:MAG: sodium:solute symporter family protein [Gammaproteobacteria bacterium]|nr:sodium:solute symporter family protein [Gammaproteobacteria bacterium]MBU1600877.1 sodium:solute symporter family protein [Gammaproteobacteria bacterium]MBU2435333.1 sodium:solute symporter family protein [Gammaproteobacteria bacterium]MBU2448747.1 sodium:solute symporter family protein [Gammaproteobacteria bacterium]
MLLWFVILYLLVSVGIGLFAATRVHNAKDFAVAGRSLPFPVVMATVFATWFGAESIFGISSTFLKDGLGGIVADPFGSSICLILAGILFSRYLYKLNIITLGDFYRLRYNRTVEILTTLCIVVSYLGWVAAQTKALGLLFSVVSDGAISEAAGMCLGTALVLTYTIFGGMLSVAILDFVQMIVMLGGLLLIAFLVAGKVDGGAGAVISHAAGAGKFTFFPDGDPWLWLTFVGSAVTMMFGSIPQQDVFQRVTSAKTQRIALWGSVTGASLYFVFTFVPIFIAYAATLVDPARFGGMVDQQAEQIIPTLVSQQMPLIAQVLFYGAVLSAIMSTSSATLLAPSVTFSENIIRGLMPSMGDRQFLFVMRCVLFIFALLVLTFALNSTSTIFQMVEGAYKITLAGAFAPLVGGILWRRATTQGALCSIFGGVVSWLLVELLIGQTSLVPPQLIGLAVSILGMIAGSLLPQWVGHPLPHEDIHAALHHRAAAETHHATEHPHHH